MERGYRGSDRASAAPFAPRRDIKRTGGATRASGAPFAPRRDIKRTGRTTGGDRLGRTVIDSHTHLFLCERPEAELVADALAAGVSRMLNVGLGGAQNDAAIAAAEADVEHAAHA